MEIYLVTQNKKKVEEFEKILGFKLNHVDLKLKEIQAIEVKKVVEHKARQAFLEISHPVIVEDTGLYFEAWGGLPGALAKLFDQTLGYSRLCKMLKGNRRAKAQTVIGFFDGEKYQGFLGKVEGTIPSKPRGEKGFGWDRIFVPKGFTKTFAQMEPHQKNKVSMRKFALDKLSRFLDSYLKEKKIYE